MEYYPLPTLLLGFLSLFQISIFMLTAKRDISFFMSPLWHQVRECKHKGSFRCVDTSNALKICKQFFISWVKSIYTKRKIHLSEHTNMHLSLCAFGKCFCCYYFALLNNISVLDLKHSRRVLFYVNGVLWSIIPRRPFNEISVLWW